MLTVLLFILFAGLAIGCAVAMVAQRHPLYSAIALIGVFMSLACLYLMLAAPFIAAVQVIVYAGAIMVLVVFVIMLLNVEAEERRRPRLVYLAPLALGMASVLIAEVAFVLFSVPTAPFTPQGNSSSVGLTASIGAGLFTKYLLPFEITSILLLMALVGAMTLARRALILSPFARVVPGAQSLPKHLMSSAAYGDLSGVETSTTAAAADLLGVADDHDPSQRD